MKKFILIFLITLACTIISQPSLADSDKDEDEKPWSKFQINLGWYFADLNSSFRLGSSAVGIDVDVEEFLGLDSSGSTFRFGAFYRFGRTGRHAVAADWFRFRRSGSRQILEEIEFPPDSGNIISPGVTVKSVFNFDLISARYRYALLYDERMDVNFGAGLFVMPIEFGLGEQGEDVPETSITAPLPTLGFGFDFAITPKWFVRQSIDAMYLEFDNFRGRILDYQIAVEHKPWKHWAFGLGFESMSIEVQVQGDTSWPGLEDFDGSLEFGFNGLRAYLKYIFY